MPKVMVVEDDQDLALLLRTVLEDQGYAIETAANGRQALELLAGENPDLILLDMKMPVMNGWQFAEEYHRRYDSPAPIVVLTASEQAARNAREVKASAWLGKPFDLGTLVSMVRDYLPLG